MRIERLEHVAEKQKICQSILDDLPDWFGVETTNQSYVRTIVDYPMFVAYLDNRQPVGFLSLRERTLLSSEIYLLGVLQAYHHQGIGTALIQTAENEALKSNKRFLQVNTIPEMIPNLEIDLARKFYGRYGYVMKEIEGERLVLVKTLEKE
jgi:GNAT superfamily N-acetyltransferase